MRKLLLTAIAALALTSCQKDDVTDITDVLVVKKITATQKDPSKNKGAYIDFIIGTAGVTRADYIDGSDFGPIQNNQGDYEVGAKFSINTDFGANGVTVKYLLNAAGAPTVSIVTFTDSVGKILVIVANVTSFESTTTGHAVGVVGTAEVTVNDFKKLEIGTTVEVDYTLFLSE